MATTETLTYPIWQGKGTLEAGAPEVLKISMKAPAILNWHNQLPKETG